MLATSGEPIFACPDHLGRRAAGRKAVNRETAKTLWPRAQARFDNKIEPCNVHTYAGVRIVDATNRDTRLMRCTMRPRAEFCFFYDDVKSPLLKPRGDMTGLLGADEDGR